MPVEIQLPRLGWSMEEGKFLAWLKQPGEFVTEGEPLFTLESDKAAQEVEAIDSGLLSLAPDAPQPGEIVKVGRVLGWLLAEGETAPVESTAAGSSHASEVPKTDLPPAKPAAPPSSPSHASSTGSYPVSPRARRAARTNQVSLTGLVPSGTGGRLCERDVLKVAQTAPAPLTTLSGEAKEIPVTPRRRAIAERLTQSHRDTVPVTLTCRINAEPLLVLRQQLKAGGETGQLSIVPTLNDILVKFTACALQKHPLLSGVWAGDRIILPPRIDVGIAVDTEEGLLVPVIRGPAQMPLTHVAEQSHRLIGAARAGHLSAADQQGSCFTVSNLGRFGIESFTPIINPPETAILGVGAITQDAVPLNDSGFTFRSQLGLNLTFDHRVIDGAPAARFLQTLRHILENPFWGLA